MNQQENNKAVVRAYAQGFSRGEFEDVLKLFAADAVVQGVLGRGGFEVVVPIWRALHEAFGMQLEIEELIAEGDLVAARFIESGTFRAAFRGTPPTGKNYRLVAMEWFRLKHGKITEPGALATPPPCRSRSRRRGRRSAEKQNGANHENCTVLEQPNLISAMAETIRQ
jgi:predicted ester cyclase